MPYVMGGLIYVWFSVFFTNIEPPIYLIYYIKYGKIIIPPTQKNDLRRLKLQASGTPLQPTEVSHTWSAARGRDPRSLGMALSKSWMIQKFCFFQRNPMI